MSRRRRRRSPADGARESAGGPGPDSADIPSRRPRWLLTAVTCALPVVLLVVVEAGLRAAGYGRSLEPVFIDAPGMPGYRQANPRAVLRLFTDPAEAPSVTIETAYFSASKPTGTVRLVVQGASSAAGFPYGLGASLAGVLEQRLRRGWPEREIEVVSTAMAAVNSYALVDFAEDILAEQPDAIVVYIGHNEYLGILGVGSTLRVAGSPWITRTFMAARRLRLFQLVESLIPDQSPMSGGAGSAEPSLMARVAGERSIPLDSRLYRNGLEQFEHNLDALLGIYERAGVPVYIGTLVSNERDQPPFAGAAAAGAFERARRLLAAGDPTAARSAYREARDLDELRFRAPSAFNDILRRVAARHGARVVESERRLAEASPQGIIGASLMLEHVHPNLDGYFLLADSFFDRIVADGLLGEPAVRITDEQARHEMPVTDVDRWLGIYKTGKLRSGWPFRDRSVEYRLPPPASEGERLAQGLYREHLDWPRAQQALREHYHGRGDKAGYAQVTQVLADAFPATGRLQFDTAAALIDVGRPLDALRYAHRAARLGPREVDSWLVLGHALALLGRRDEAKSALRQALALEPGNAVARAAIAQLERPTVPAPASEAPAPR